MAGEGGPQDAAHDMGNHLPLLPGNGRAGARVGARGLRAGPGRAGAGRAGGPRAGGARGRARPAAPGALPAG